MHRRQLLPLAEQRASYTSTIYHKKENACKKEPAQLASHEWQVSDGLYTLYHDLPRRLKIRPCAFLKRNKHRCYGEVRIINSKGEMKIIKRLNPPV